VVDDNEKDESEPAICQFPFSSDRKKLIEAARVIVWDEMIFNHKELYEAAYDAARGFTGKVLICMGDFRQILPAV
jgi:hypothetical protein